MLVWSSILFLLIILIIKCANNYYDAFKEMTSDFNSLSYDYNFETKQYKVLTIAKNGDHSKIKFYNDPISSPKEIDFISYLSFSEIVEISIDNTKYFLIFSLDTNNVPSLTLFTTDVTNSFVIQLKDVDTKLHNYKMLPLSSNNILFFGLIEDNSIINIEQLELTTVDYNNVLSATFSITDIVKQMSCQLFTNTKNNLMCFFITPQTSTCSLKYQQYIIETNEITKEGELTNFINNIDCDILRYDKIEDSNAGIVYYYINNQIAFSILKYQ